MFPHEGLEEAELGRQDVEQALIAMQDDAVRRRLLDGDLAALDGLSMSSYEETLVRDAAADYPEAEVAGFGADAVAALIADSQTKRYRFAVLDGGTGGAGSSAPGLQSLSGFDKAVG